MDLQYITREDKDATWDKTQQEHIVMHDVINYRNCHHISVCHCTPFPMIPYVISHHHNNNSDVYRLMISNVLKEHLRLWRLASCQRHRACCLECCGIHQTHAPLRRRSCLALSAPCCWRYVRTSAVDSQMCPSTTDTSSGYGLQKCAKHGVRMSEKRSHNRRVQWSTSQSTGDDNKITSARKIHDNECDTKEWMSLSFDL